MSNYKFHIDKPLPDSRQISRHKDFERLYGRYETATRFGFWRKLLRRPRLFASVVLLAVVVWLVYEAGEKEVAMDTRVVQPQMELNLPFVQAENALLPGDWKLCAHRVFTSLEMYYAAGIPLSFESGETTQLLQPEHIVQIKGCDIFPPAAAVDHAETESDSISQNAKPWYLLDEKTGEWRVFAGKKVEQDSAFFAQGSIMEMPQGTARKIRLLDDQGKNLSRRLGKKHRQVFLVLFEQKTLFPIPYDGEGKHILPFVPDNAAIWAVDEKQQGWEVDPAALESWGNSEAIDILPHHHLSIKGMASNQFIHINPCRQIASGNLKSLALRRWIFLHHATLQVQHPQAEALMMRIHKL